MNIILTGATGFIGRNLQKKLSSKSNSKILCISRSKVEPQFSKNIFFLKCDLNNLERYRKMIVDFKPDILVHLAWDKIPNFSKKNSKKNEKISKKLIDFFCLNTNIKNIIVTGSCFEIQRPNSSYTYFVNAKKEILNYLKKKSIKHKINFNWLRIFYVYGPGQREKSIIPYIISCSKLNKIAEVKYLNNRHDFIFIDDVCNAIIKTIKFSKTSKILDVGSVKTTSIKQILNYFKSISKNKFFYKSNAKSKKNLIVKADVKTVKKYIKWSANTDIKIGLKKTYNSF